MKIGDLVTRKPLPDNWGPLKRGHVYFGLAMGEIGRIIAIEDKCVYIEGHADWCHSIDTLEVKDESVCEAVEND